MNVDSLSDNLSDCHTRIKRCGWILENNLHFLTVRKHVYRFRFAKWFAVFVQRIVKNCLTVIDNLTTGRLIQSENGSSQSCFTASISANNGVNLALPYFQVKSVQYVRRLPVVSEINILKFYCKGIIVELNRFVKLSYNVRTIPANKRSCLSYVNRTRRLYAKPLIDSCWNGHSLNNGCFLGEKSAAGSWYAEISYLCFVKNSNSVGIGKDTLKIMLRDYYSHTVFTVKTHKHFYKSRGAERVKL